MDLKQVLAPPASPKEPGDPDRWAEVEGNLGLILPADFKKFITTYGTGCVDGFLWVLNPFTANSNLNLEEQVPRQLEALRELKDVYGEEIPYPLYPEDGGLLPWGLSDNGDILYWLSRGAPNSWPTVLKDSRAPEWELHKESLSGLLRKVLTRQVVVKIFPDDFPSSHPRFTPL